MLSKWWKVVLLPLLVIYIFNSCLVTNQKFDKLMPGIWRGELYLDENGNADDISNWSGS